jgi:hypothetical protein
MVGGGVARGQTGAPVRQLTGESVGPTGPVALAQRDGFKELVFDTPAVRGRFDRDGIARATLTSVATYFEAIENSQVDRALHLIHRQRSGLDSSLPPQVAFAGAIHQGQNLSRPGLLLVKLRAGEPGVRVTGAAVPIPDPAMPGH